MTNIIERAIQLINTNRYQEAEVELRKILATDPQNAEILSLLAICKAETGNIAEALNFIGQAIGFQPTNDHFLYILATIHLKDDKASEAEKVIREAIAINPSEAGYFGLLSNIKLSQRFFEEALELANKGLEISPDNLSCLNQRSKALYKLDRKDEAYSTIQEALSHDPENEVTHANLGWSLLEKREHTQALVHFREALKINPHFSYAKAGLVEGLKARYWLYRIFLRYSFWISNLNKQAQWAVMIGLYVGIRIMRWASDTNETLGRFLRPIIILYMIFAISTWVIGPLSNLFLRLNVFGRYALDEQEIISSNYVGMALATAVAGCLGWLFTFEIFFVMLIIFGISMMIPLASMFSPSKRSSRLVLIGCTCLLLFLGSGALVQYLQTGDVGTLSVIYIFGIVAYQWVANAFIIR